jgi:hypothetical protein
MDTPQFIHDCESCVFLGNHPLFGGPADAYVCPQGGSPTVVFRQGDDGPDYQSASGLIEKLPADAQSVARSFMRKHRDRKWRSDYRRKERRARRRAVRRAGLLAAASGEDSEVAMKTVRMVKRVPSPNALSRSANYRRVSESEYQKRRDRLTLEGVDGDEDADTVTYWYEPKDE